MCLHTCHSITGNDWLALHVDVAYISLISIRDYLNNNALIVYSPNNVTNLPIISLEFCIVFIHVEARYCMAPLIGRYTPVPDMPQYWRVSSSFFLQVIFILSLFYLTIHVVFYNEHEWLAKWRKWRACDVEKRKEGWRISCDVGEATEGLENELWRRWSDGKVGEWAVT